MSAKIPVHIGSVFGRWCVLAEVGPHGRNRVRAFRCVCVCGSEAIVGSMQLRSGKSQSCGCLRRDCTIERNRSPGWLKKRCIVCRKQFSGRPSALSCPGECRRSRQDETINKYLKANRERILEKRRVDRARNPEPSRKRNLHKYHKMAAALRILIRLNLIPGGPSRSTTTEAIGGRR
jgi:hypothetical protein